MIRERGGNRFNGYGNVQVYPGKPQRGWQLTCSQCGAKSQIIHRNGPSYPPKILTRMFSGWRVGSQPDGDVCEKCLYATRDKRKEERKQYVDGAVDRLLGAIKQVEQLLTQTVTVDFGNRQPEIMAQFKALFETAYLCNMFVPEEVAPPPKTVVKIVETVKVIAPPPPPPEPELPAPDPEIFPLPETRRASAPPCQSSVPLPQMSARTAAYLAEMRKQVFNGR